MYYISKILPQRDRNGERQKDRVTDRVGQRDTGSARERQKERERDGADTDRDLCTNRGGVSSFESGELRTKFP